MTDHVHVSAADGCMEILISRPERKNALTAEMYLAMAQAIERAEEDAAIRVILFLGADDIFTAGNDLADFIENPPAADDSPVMRFMLAVARSTRVIVAGVSGPAVGIGTTLLLHCDLAIAGESARFLMPFVDLGIVPEFASSRLLPDLIGRRRAGAHLLLGEPFDAMTALAYGVISAVVPDDAVGEAARDHVRRLLAKPPQALAKARRLLAPPTDGIEALIRREVAEFSQCLRSAEFAEAARAFFEKRPPDFSRL